MVGMSTAMPEASYGVMSNTLKPLTNAQTVRGRPTFHLQVSSNKQCFHHQIHVFSQCDYSFHDLSLRHACISVHPLHILFLEPLDSTRDRHPALRSAPVATARLTILDRLFLSTILVSSIRQQIFSICFIFSDRFGVNT